MPPMTGGLARVCPLFPGMVPAQFIVFGVFSVFRETFDTPSIDWSQSATTEAGGMCCPEPCPWENNV